MSWELSSQNLRVGSSPIGPSISPVRVPKAGNGDTATVVAFRNARDKFRNSLSEKDMKRIMIPTGPEDVVNEIDKWHHKHAGSKFAASVRSGLGQLQRFNASIDMLAQGTPSPGCLLWGSIKFVLTIVQDAVQAYEQLCKALIRMTDCLPRIEIYAETFFESSLVVDCVNAFYVSDIRFWAKACKFYRRRRLWKILHVIWNDFDAEFADLEADMIRNRDRVEGAALAEHIGDSRTAKLNQQFVNSELLDGHTSARQKEITVWLAPVAYDVEYFSNDLVSARALRHPKTCMWILQKTEVAQLLDSSCGLELSMLWIYANPGAGKTILSSFLIDHLKSAKSDPVKGNVLYFFCKNTDVDKNTPTAVVRSLLYQLYNSVKHQKAGQSLNHDIGAALDRSGQQKAVNFAVLWQLFSTHILNSTPVTIIIDALDECQDPNQLIEGLKDLATSRFITVIVTSRKESNLHNELDSVSSMEIAPEDIDADIAAFVEAKIEASSRLSHPLVRELVATKLCNSHDGMFLWVYLVLKELKSCISMAQVQDALAKLPTGLDGIYKSILGRLQTTLSRSSFDLCSKVLTWVVSAVRPLWIHEIKHALTLHYEMNGDTLLADDQSFPYSDKDMELICGSLVTIRRGTMQVIHLTVKEFIGSPPENSGLTSSSLLVDPRSGSLQLTLVCLECISKYAEPLLDLESKAPHIGWAPEPNVLERRLSRAPLLEYASFSWLVHMIECKLDDLDKIIPTFKKTFGSPTTFSWIETCMALQRDSALRLSVGISEVHDWLCEHHQGFQVQEEASTHFLISWCAAISSVFEEYGAVLYRRAWEVHLIDLYGIFSVNSVLRDFWQKYGETALREKDLSLNRHQASHPQHQHFKQHLQLQKPLRTQPHEFGMTSMFLVHNEEQNIYIWGEGEIKADSHCIYIQHEKTGRRLPPSEDTSLGPGQSWRLIDHGLSPNGEYLVLCYNSGDMSECSNLTVAWQIMKNTNFKRRMNREPWARVVFRHTSDSERFSRGSKAIVFKNGHCCMTAIGTLNLLTGSRRPLPTYVTNWIDKSTRLFYSRNGQYLFVSGFYDSSNNTYIQARRADTSEPSQFVDFRWEDQRRHLADVSPSGRYLVLVVTWSFAEEAVYLYDTIFNRNLKLPLPEQLEYMDSKFHFSREETRLTCFLFMTSAGLAVMIWDCLELTPRLMSHARLDVDWKIEPNGIHANGIHVHKAAASAVVVMGTKTIQRIELGERIKFLDVGSFIDEYPHRLSTVSRDSSHWALVSYGWKGGKVQIIDLWSPDAPARHFVLQWSQSDIPETLVQTHSLPVGISQDLRVLVINAEVFDLTTTAIGKDPSERMTPTPFTLEAAPALLRPHRYHNKARDVTCLISPCNSYVVYVGSGDPKRKDTPYSSAFLLYRIDVQKRTSARLELMLPRRMGSISASFHPSLPLLTLSYASLTGTELTHIKDLPADLDIVICDLRSLEIMILEIPRAELKETIARRWRRFCLLPQPLFSDSGTFVYLENRAARKDWWFQKLSRIDTATLPSRHIHDLRPLSLDNSIVAFHNSDYASVELELIKFDDQGFWRGTRPAVFLGDIASYSSHLAAADLFLLLGENDDQKMRMLIAPHDDRSPVIKTLSLTFAEARARLEREWRRLQVESQDRDLEETVGIRQ